ncbi:thymidylate kinase [Chryseobacterium sp. CBTAP 102]|nr:thymidylate kinase [Chryseobacterium sp. CBTAP 102]
MFISFVNIKWYIMRNLFKNTGYKLYLKQQSGSKRISFSYIPNQDGSVRWFWNSGSKKPLFLKFYNITTIKGKLFAFVVRMIFFLRLQRLLFKKEILYYTSEENPLFDIMNDWAIFTGTQGPNNKAVLFADNCFFKIASTKNAKNLINKEYKIITYSGINTLYSAPSASLINDCVLKLSDISNNGKRQKKFSEVHAKALHGIKEKHQTMIKISNWKHFDTLIENFSTIDDNRIPPNLTRKLKIILENIDKDEMIHLSFSHGDFTPWNCFVKDDILGIYDWELASFEKPKGFDFFHFIIQNGILVQHIPWKEILVQIRKHNKIAFNFDDNDLKKYLKFYLLTNVLYYLKLYSEQEQWHLQVHWLLKVWSEALNMYLTEIKTERELLIMDIFDYLYHEKYATLKFHDKEPENLPLNSDIDIVISCNDASKMALFLKQNSLVNRMKIVKKSFMYKIRLITHDLQILNLDLIYQLKWKSLEYMETNGMINHAEMNRYGVKISSPQDTAKYIYYFYTLNNSEIPDAYKNFVYENTSEKMRKSKTECITMMKRKRSNRGFLFLKNLCCYFKDFFSEKGFIITFSGVDGVGKSTVISEVSELIEKRYRRPVKVLRHRPSLLPILSVFTKGKEKAHQDIVNSLPRQGKNDHFFSSLLRFTYYYTDYIIGQFIIYLKYVLRGKIVLYDRYYFDFIADSKRSNIKLPEGITENGYHLLLKPKFNFFLYADPEKILDRKKELSYHSICDLTASYGRLFSKLEKKDPKIKYLSIENNDLDTTLSTIMNTITAAK